MNNYSIKDLRQILFDSKKDCLDLLIINPSIDWEKDKQYLNSLKVDPEIPRQQSPKLGIAYMLAVGKEHGLKVEYLDMTSYGISLSGLFDYISKKQPRVIGFTAFTVQIKSAAVIADLIKKKYPEILICVGGPHAVAVPEETIQEFPCFDIAVSTEGEEIFRESGYHNIDELPFPAWESFLLEKYPGADPHDTNLELPMSTSRGCPFNCVFCARQFGKKRRSRSINSIIDELWRNVNEFNCESIAFCDETFVVNINWSKNLFQRMIDEGLHEKLKWSCEMRVDICSYDLFKLMKDVGCYYVFFGFESGDDQILKNCGKNFTATHIAEAAEDIKKAGIVSAGSFILGLPGETKETAWKSIKLAKDLNIYSTTFPIAVPFPGTEMRKMAENHEYGLKILTNDWDDYGKQYPGVMDSDNLSIDELRSLQKEAYEYNPKKTIENYVKTVLYTYK